MIDCKHDLPLTRQAEVLKLSRSSLYTDQGSQFTDRDFVDLIRKKHGIALSMDCRATGAIMSSSSAFGDRSSTKRSIFMRTRAHPRRARRSASTSTSTTASARTRPSTDKRRMPYTFLHEPSLRRPNLRLHHLAKIYPLSKNSAPPLPDVV